MPCAVRLLFIGTKCKLKVIVSSRLLETQKMHNQCQGATSQQSCWITSNPCVPLLIFMPVYDNTMLLCVTIIYIDTIDNLLHRIFFLRHPVFSILIPNNYGYKIYPLWYFVHLSLSIYNLSLALDISAAWFKSMFK